MSPGAGDNDRAQGLCNRGLILDRSIDTRDRHKGCHDMMRFLQVDPDPCTTTITARQRKGFSRSPLEDVQIVFHVSASATTGS